ncbi:MAG: hypothetical protein M1816_005020 [Peltula sp. TS41687]|nr:MAG: hypothetical protein M1816_005020 [Peltula sp. TS41687]
MASMNEPGMTYTTTQTGAPMMNTGSVLPLVSQETYPTTIINPPVDYQATSAQGYAAPVDGRAYGSNFDTWTNSDGGSSQQGAPLEVLCGPLLNYKYMTDAQTTAPRWHGSVLLVTKPGDVPPKLQLRHVGAVGRNGQADGSQGTSGAYGGYSSNNTDRTFTGFKLHSDPNKAFWRIDLDLPFQTSESRWEYSISNANFASGTRTEGRSTRTFFVPSKDQSMRVMFHSCNGFSVGVNQSDWSGPALWNDVLRVHEEKPFHVMIGGGDQIYNDSVRVSGPLKEWTAIKNPSRRRQYPFREDLRAQCDEFYFQNYVRWYTTEPFATANGQIPQINIWDDHDIIDGFGSYTDDFMMCHVFRGIGGVAQKYYLLFQHHQAPPVSTFTTDAPQTQAPQGAGPDPVQLQGTFTYQGEPDDRSYIIGARPGPYVAERSRSMFTRLGKRMAFLGIDARTERTRHQINYPDTYDLLFRRLDSELTAARGEIKHVLMLLGVPIAYPRLIWLENILRSPIIGPIRFLNKRFGVAEGFFNKFDEEVDLLDDLDDHYTARQHKPERKELILRLQEASYRHNVRITILSGDVHLAALGRFYSNQRLEIPVRNDHRYMVNVVSSAITNKPPPEAVANMLARRNRIHHLDSETDETLLNLFDRGPGDKPKAAANNHCTMPSRNYAILTETGGGGDDNNKEDDGLNGTATIPTSNTNGSHHHHGPSLFHRHSKRDDHNALHPGEENAGTKHPAASGMESRIIPGDPFGLDVTIRVEIDPSDREGRTDGYGVHVPALRSSPKAQAPARGH